MSEQTKINDAVRALLEGTMPEYLTEVGKLTETTEYEVVHDRPAFHCEALGFPGSGLVSLTNRSMQQIWLISYISWRTLVEQCGLVVGALITEQPYEPSLLSKNDPFISSVDNLESSLTKLRTAEAGSNPWPPHVPELDPELTQILDKQDRAAYDLACFAAAFVLLHETCHAEKRARNEPFSGIAEELECDRYAIKLVLSGCEDYAHRHNYKPIDVHRKRAMGLFIGLAVTFESTDRGIWLPSQTHPSAHDRISQLIGAVKSTLTDPNDPFWVFASCMLLSKLRRGGRSPGTIAFENVRDLFFKALALIKLD